MLLRAISILKYWQPCWPVTAANTHTHTHPFNGPLSRTTRVSRYQKGETNLDFTEARDSEWHWHQLGHMQVCTSLQTDNHASTPPLSFLQAGCPSCHPTNSVKALKATAAKWTAIHSSQDCQGWVVQLFILSISEAKICSHSVTCWPNLPRMSKSCILCFLIT